MKAVNYLIPIITLIAQLVPPIAGMLFVEYFVFRPVKKHPANGGVRWAWIPAWLSGGIAGIWSYYESFFISPINALVVSGVVYALLRITMERRKPYTAVRTNRP